MTKSDLGLAQGSVGAAFVDERGGRIAEGLFKGDILYVVKKQSKQSDYLGISERLGKRDGRVRLR